MMYQQSKYKMMRDECWSEIKYYSQEVKNMFNTRKCKGTKQISYYIHIHTELPKN